MSSDSVFSSLPSTSRPPPKMTGPPPLPSEQSQSRSDKRWKQKGTGSSVSSRAGDAPDNSLSLKGQVLQVLAMALVAWLVATGGFKSVEWVQQQLKPFCDSSSTNDEAKVSEDCIPCPRNGSCRNGNLECFIGFKKVGKSCVNDKEIDQTAEKLAGYLKSHICGLAARAACDGASGAVRLADDEAQFQLKEQGLQEQLGLDDKSWQLVWEKMAVIAEDSSIAKLNYLEGKRGFSCPDELIQRYKTVKCRIKDWIWANIFSLILTSPLLLVVATSINKYLRRKKTIARAEQVYLQVCEALEEKALESKEMTGKESWVVVSRLRDHILLPSERKWTALWSKVEGLVREDSRIDQYQKKVQGEMKIVWEWQVEGAVHTPGVRNKVRQKARSKLSAS